MIIGAQKAGTTSLLHYLGEHPDCFSHPQKELGYFTDDKEYNDGLDRVFRKYYADLSESHKKVIGKNASLLTNKVGLQRLKDINPDCQIVVILRNPVERTYSSYLMEKNYSAVKFKFEELPDLINKHAKNDESWGFNFFIDFSLYAHHLKDLYSFFPKEQVTVILYRELKSDATGVCREIFEKLGVDPNFKPNVAVKHNETKKTRSLTYSMMVMRLLKNNNPIKRFLKLFIPEKNSHKYGDLLRNINKVEERYEPIDPKVKDYLIGFYKPHNDELEQMIGKDLSDWNK